MEYQVRPEDLDLLREFSNHPGWELIQKALAVAIEARKEALVAVGGKSGDAAVCALAQSILAMQRLSQSPEYMVEDIRRMIERNEEEAKENA